MHFETNYGSYCSKNLKQWPHCPCFEHGFALLFVSLGYESGSNGNEIYKKFIDLHFLSTAATSQRKFNLTYWKKNSAFNVMAKHSANPDPRWKRRVRIRLENHCRSETLHAWKDYLSADLSVGHVVGVWLGVVGEIPRVRPAAQLLCLVVCGQGEAPPPRTRAAQIILFSRCWNQISYREIIVDNSKEKCICGLLDHL